MSIDEIVRGPNQLDTISIDGSTGEVMVGAVPVVQGQLDENFAELMAWVDEARRQLRLAQRAEPGSPLAREARRWLERLPDR